MKILLSGASSFTGMHIAEHCFQAKHQVMGTYRKSLSAYTGVAQKRIARLSGIQKSEHTVIGSPKFLQLIHDFSPDVYIHHAFDTSGYHQPDFPLDARVEAALHNMDLICAALVENGCRGILYSDSFFAGSGNVDTDGRVPFSSYGTAKKRVGDRLEADCQQSGLAFWRMVIPNPIGPLDKPKLLHSLWSAWAEGRKAKLHAPHLIRDHIPVDLLAKAYLRILPDLYERKSGISNPSGWICTVEELTLQAGEYWTHHTGRKAAYTIEARPIQQPAVLANTESIWALAPEWSESAFWKELILEFLNS